VPVHYRAPQCGVVNVMDKSNIAFGLISGILAIYIAVALLLSRVRRSHLDKTGPHQTGHHRLAGHK
jgi:hypothetical protein